MIKAVNKPRKKPRLSARAKIVSYLARREHSQFELRTKLALAGYEPSEIDEALTFAIAHRFQDEGRFVASLARRRASVYGDRAIEAEIQQHRIESVDQAPAWQIDSEEDRAFDWICKRIRTKALEEQSDDATRAPSLELKSKVFRALAARGFEFSNIDKAWRRFITELNSDQ